MTFPRLIALMMLLSGPAVAQQAPPSGAAPALHITGSGEFTATRDLGPRNPNGTAPGDTIVMVENPRIVRRTSRIEAQLCRRFGFMFTVELPPGATLDLQVQSVHPPILDPSGAVSTGMTYDMTASNDQEGLVGYSFDEPWELAPGTWTFTVRLGGKVLAEQSYEVTPSPDPAPATGGGCSAVTS